MQWGDTENGLEKAGRDWEWAGRLRTPGPWVLSVRLASDQWRAILTGPGAGRSMAQPRWTRRDTLRKRRQIRIDWHGRGEPREALE